MNLKFDTIVQIYGKIKQLNSVVILKNTNEYCQKIISKSGHKMDLYLAMGYLLQVKYQCFSRQHWSGFVALHPVDQNIGLKIRA